MTTLAEGVETAEQHNELRAVGCDSCKGPYFARPMPADDLDGHITDLAGGNALYLPRKPRAALSRA